MDSAERSDHSHSTRPVSAQHSRGAFDGDVFPAVCATAGSSKLLLFVCTETVTAGCTETVTALCTTAGSSKLLLFYVDPLVEKTCSW